MSISDLCNNHGRIYAVKCLLNVYFRCGVGVMLEGKPRRWGPFISSWPASGNTRSENTFEMLGKNSGDCIQVLAETNLFTF